MDKPADKAREQMRSMGLSAPYIGSRETRTEEEIAQDRKTLAENVPILGEAMLAKEIVGDVKDKDYLSAGLNTAALGVGIIPGPGKVVSKAIRKFNKTRKAYKVAVQAEDKKLYPLFVNADKELPVGEWIEADFPKSTFKGKRTPGSEEKNYVPTKGAKRTKGEKTKNTGDPIIIPDEATRKSLIKDGFITERTKKTKEAPFGKVTAVAARPGLHASQAPVATHLGPQDLKVSKKEVDKLLEAGVTSEAIKRRGNQYYIKRRAEDQVFVEVEMADDVDYQSMLAKEGKTDINDRVPKGGSYRYSDGQADSDQWVVGGDMKITKVLSRDEARQIQKERGVVDLPYRDEVEKILGRKFSKEIKLEKFETAKVAKINKTWWLDKDTVTLYHGTNKKNLKNVSGEGLKPDAEGFVYLTPDPNTAAGYASMSGTGGEAAFRKSGRAVNTPEEDRVILKYKIPKKEFLKIVDQNKQRKGPLNPNYDVDKDKLFNKDVFDKHIKRKAKDDYYATTEIRFPENNPFDKYLTSFSNRKNALKLDELELAEGGVVMDDYQLAKVTDEPQNYAKGGIAKQMEMFQDGGLMDEGGTVDPVSGNDVPPGSNQEEVRDDIPAQLSEGEFVFPADVVRFIGLEKLMMIRQRAKAGLQRMEDMGQMGNSEEAVMPDDLPFSIEDLDMEDDGLEMAQGGVVHMANGGTYNVPDPSAGVYYNPAGSSTTGVAAAPVKAASSNIARSIPIAQAATPMQAGSGKPTMFTDYELPQAPVPIMPQRDDLPAFLGEVTPGVGGVDYTEETYVNEAGATETFRRYTDGRLLDKNGAIAVIPEGYVIKSEAEKDVGTRPVKVETATVQDDGDGGDNQDDVTTGSTISFGGEIGPKGNVINSIRGNMSIRGANFGTGPLGLGGLKDVKGLMARSLSSGINQITGGKFGTPMTLNKGESVVIENLVQSRPGVNNNVDLGTVGIELDSDFYNTHVSGKGVTERGKVAEVARFVSDRYGLGKTAVYDKDGKLITPGSRLGKGSILSASQVLSQIELEKSRDERKSKVEAAQRMSGAARDRAFGIADPNFDPKTDSGTGFTPGSVIDSAIKEAQADMARDAARDSGDTSGYGEGGQEADNFGGFTDDAPDDRGMGPSGEDVGYGSGTDCLTEDMKVKLNGVINFVTNVKVGDRIDNYRVKEVLHKHMRSGYYAINNELKISNDHPVLANGTWTRPEDLSVGDTINGIPVVSLEYVEQLTPTVSIVIDGESFDVHTKNNIYTVHGRYREVRQKAA